MMHKDDQDIILCLCHSVINIQLCALSQHHSSFYLHLLQIKFKYPKIEEIIINKRSKGNETF